MSKLVQIPAAALQALLRQAGRPESIEAFLASTEVRAAVATGSRLIKRANAAYWSRFWLVLSSAVTWLGFVSGPNVEGFIAGTLLTGMTIVEYKVYRLFLVADPHGAIYGWWNQCLFAVLFLVYGGYHGFFVTVPPSVNEVLPYLGDSGVDFLPAITQMTRVTYLTIGLVGGLGQFCLACYYRAALGSGKGQ